MNYKKPNLYSLFILTILLIITVPTLTSCTPKNSVSISKSSFYLNTVITITLYNTTDEELLNQGMNLCQKYDKLFNKNDKNSDIYAINHSKGEPVTVSDDTIHLIKKGIQYANKTDGLFNIAIGSISSLWDFTGKTKNIPDQQQLTQALSYTDYTQIVISGNAVSVPEGMELDLGGIAKGYIGDQLKEYYVENQVSSALLNLGGNIVCIGTPPDKDAFHIGIKKPFSENETITSVYVNDRCVVTSGIYERYFTINNHIYHHILDPDTGYPADTDLYGVSIIADNSMEADILSTTCLMLGLEKGQEFLKQFHNVDAIFVTNKNEIISCPSQ